MTEVASGRAGVSSLLHQIERVAKYQTGNHRAALGNRKTQDAMQVLAKNHASYALDNAGLGGVGWDRLYCEVTKARNDIMHTGTEAVLAETRTKALAAVLLDALLGAAQEDGMTTIAHVMVEHPVCVHRWQTIADVRRTMLVSDFSVLPLADGAKGNGRRAWLVLTADDLAHWLGTDGRCNVEKGKKVREAKMDMNVEDAEKCGLRFRCARTEPECTRVEEVWNACETLGLPLLVTREPARGEGKEPKIAAMHLVGIVTSFDLL
ncbi:MAG: hypothetical protein F4Y86_03805 [Gammaproteobacteria bacterium]|nr:hypothetical protein [Gammaproteobacteria bacterium]